MNKSFHLKIVPPTCTSQQTKVRVVKGRFVKHYKTQALKDAEKLFMLALKDHAPSKPIEGDIKVDCSWVFPWRKSELKGIQNKYRSIPKTTKPDAGNSNKLLIDCMTKSGFWNDDAQIYSETAGKYWGDDYGIHIQITWGVSWGFEPR